MKKTVNLDAMIVRDDFKADDTAILGLKSELQ